MQKFIARLGVGMLMLLPVHPGLAVVPGPQATPPPIPSGAVLPSDRTYKLGLISKMVKPPQLLIFGGSRATRFDPAYFKRLTGLTTFNCAFSNGRPTDDWAITRWYLAKHPNVRLHVFWGVEPSLFFAKDLDPGLVQDRRLTGAFPQSIIDEAAGKQVAAVGLPRAMLCDAGAYDPLGLLTSSWYDYREAHGMTLDRSVRQWVAMTVTTRLRSVYHSTSWSLNEFCFAQTMALLNSIGTTPVIVVMPTQPLAIQLLGEQRWNDNRVRFLNNLRLLQQQYRFAILDYSRIESFGGDAGAFYDGVHVKDVNARRIAAQAFRDVPEAFR